MADEDIESGGQTDDAGETDTDADEGPADDGDHQQTSANDNGDKPTKASRPERRKALMREAKIARETAEREAAEWRQRHTALEAQVNEMRARQEERERSTQNQDKNAERKSKIADLRARAKSHLLLSAQAKDAATANAEWDRHQQLNDEAEDLRREMWAETEREKMRNELRGSIPNQEVIAERQYFSAKYPWIETNRTARAAADGRFDELVAAGRPANRQTLEEAITYVARAFKLGGNGSAPNGARLRAYEGRGQQDGEQDDGGGGSMTADDVRNNLAFKRMALGAYSNLEPEQAYAKFAKEMGSKLSAKGA